MEGEHQPQEKELAVGRLVRLGWIAERRGDDREPVFLDPTRRKEQMVTEAVVEGQRRLDDPDGDDEREHGNHHRHNRPPLASHVKLFRQNPT